MGMEQRFRRSRGAPASGGVGSTPRFFVSTRWLSWTCGGLRGVDVLIESERVVGVPATLERDEPFPVRAVGGADSVGLVSVEVVDVDGVGGVRLDELECVSYPSDVDLVLRWIEPLAGDHEVEARLAMRKCGGRRVDARHCT